MDWTVLLTVDLHSTAFAAHVNIIHRLSCWIRRECSKCYSLVFIVRCSSKWAGTSSLSSQRWVCSIPSAPQHNTKIGVSIMSHCIIIATIKPTFMRWCQFPRAAYRFSSTRSPPLLAPLSTACPPLVTVENVASSALLLDKEKGQMINQQKCKTGTCTSCQYWCVSNGE